MQHSHVLSSDVNNIPRSPEGDVAIFRTSDLCLAATLLHENFRLVGLDRQNTRQASFLFAKTEKLEGVVSAFWKDTLLCPAQSLLASLRKAKHILYDGIV